MHARKLLLSIVSFFAGLTGLGFALAEEPKPVQPITAANAPYPTPLPVQPAPILSSPNESPAVPAAGAATKSTSEELKNPLGQLVNNLKPGEPQVVINVKCVQVPAGFIEESGLTVDNPLPKTGDLCTFLNHRETKLLAALLRAYPGRRFISEPKVTLQDGQTGYMETGGAVEEVPTLVATTTNGKTVYAPQMVRYITSHIVLRVTVKISKDDGKIQLKVDREIAQAGEGVIFNPPEQGDEEQPNKKSSAVESINLDNAQVTVVVPDGGTVVMGNTIGSTRDKTKKSELLWVFTPHLVRGKP